MCVSLDVGDVTSHQHPNLVINTFGLQHPSPTLMSPTGQGQINGSLVLQNQLETWLLKRPSSNVVEYCNLGRMGHIFQIFEVWLILQSHFASTLLPCPCTEDLIFLKLFYSNEIQNIEVESSVVGLFEFRVENSFLIIHVSIRLVTYFWVLVLTPILCQHFVIQNFNKLTNTRLYIRYSSPIIYLKVFFDYLGFFMSQH